VSKRFAGILGMAIAALGFAGIVMGAGYIERNRKATTDGVVYDIATQRQNRRTGWASIGAGVGVIAAGSAIYSIVADILDRLAIIEAATAKRSFTLWPRR